MKKISQKIIDYAIWYYLRYYPSPNKLKQKLKDKFWPDSEKGKKYGWINEKQINFIISEKLKNIIQEDEVIKAKIRNYKDKQKSKKYILQKMFQRQENMDLVNLFLEEIFWETWEDEAIKKEYEKLLKKYDKKFEWYELKNKIYSSLVRKGFSYDRIKNIIN
jgi:SOS response regulatory protein OraA/RecX